VPPGGRPWVSGNYNATPGFCPEHRLLAAAASEERYALEHWEDVVSTFLFLALFSAFLAGMAAGALARRIVD
jgi:hypothetical protein